MKPELKLSSLVLAMSLALTGCGGSSSSSSNSKDEGADTTTDDTQQTVVTAEGAAVIATVAADFTGSDIEIVDFAADELTAVNGYAESDQSDITVDANGGDYYRLGRFGQDNLTKWNIENPGVVQWQYSVRSEAESSANPYDLVFASDTKAYLVRYDSAIVWIVNPQATTEDEFKIGEIDLSAYDDGDGIPELSGGIIVDGKLFIMAQRLSREAGSFAPENTSYLIVIDTETDTEIATGQGEDGFNGIALTGRNPGSIAYVDNVGLLVQSTGGYFPESFLGGIEKVDTETYETTLLIDDGDDENHPYGLITNLAVIDDQKAYFIGYAAWQDTSLYPFNPSTGEVGEVIAQYQGIDMRGITAGPSGKLWVSVADQADPRVSLLDPQTNTEVAQIKTLLNPTTVVFVE